MDLSLTDLRIANANRNVEAFEGSHTQWNPAEWGCALGGECGELLNLLKKQRRGEPIPHVMIAEELADIILYADLLADHLGINLSTAIIHKFNKTSDRIGANVKLPTDGLVELFSTTMQYRDKERYGEEVLMQEGL